MKATVSPIAQRIALQLDGAMPFEALILTRHAQLPASRQQEWLRGLLVRGFECECRALRAIQGEEQDGATAPPTAAIAVVPASVSEARPAPPTPARPMRARRMPGDSDKVVSLASLRKVIG